MRPLAFVFACMTLYGLFTGLYGAAMLSTLMFFLVLYGQQHFVQQELSWSRSPASAVKGPTTLSLLNRAGVECSDPNDPA